MRMVLVVVLVLISVASATGDAVVTEEGLSAGAAVAGTCTSEQTTSGSALEMPKSSLQRSLRTEKAMAKASVKFERPIRIPDDIQLGIADPPVARAGERGSWTGEFILGKDVPANQVLWLQIHGGRNNKGAWRNLQADHESKEGYVALRRASGEKLQPREASDDGGIMAFEVPKEGLKSGERIIMELGGRAGAVAPGLSLPNKFFLLVTASREERLGLHCLAGETLNCIAGACLMHIVGNNAERLVAYAKSQAVAGQELSLLVRPEDKNGNVASGELGPLVVRLNGRELDARRVPVEDSTCCILEGIVLPTEGVYRLEVEDTSSGLKTITNPIACSKALSDPSVLWGLIHAHTEMSDGCASLDHCYTYMRDKCGLEFGAASDHDHLWETSDDMWRMTQEAAVKYNQPGRFTTFLGYEWAKWRKNGDGDRNVYYLHDRRPMFRSDDGEYPTPKDLFRALKSEAALIIPHHPAEIRNHCDWKDHDPEKERLVEIYSFWGNSERSVNEGNPFPARATDRKKPDSGENPLGFVQRALELGWRVGFTAGSDDHSGHPGDQRTHGGKPWDYKGGLTAVYAEDNTRESIWEALYNRRCYGTTGARMIVNFELDGHPMGSELLVSEHPELASKRKLKVSVHGTDKLKTVEIVRNNKGVYAITRDAPDAAFVWEDTDPLADVNLAPALYSPAPFTFYYLRVTQADGEMAWSSPMWVLP